jgi:DNA (cytosine-5)-methyltransferase 1
VIRYNYLDLFSGIGGFALGAYMAGMKFDNHFCSDIEPYCQKLYKLRFPDSIQLGDITKIDTEELKKYGNNWIVTGGFPCQDISIAGKGAGITGSRSGLWFEYWRIIRDLRPRFAIMENVSALSFRGLDTVLGSLAEIRYNAEWQNIRASDMGAPHKRERVWIVAYPGYGIRGMQDKRRNGIDNKRKPIKKTIKASGSNKRQEILADSQSRESGQSSEREGRESISRGSSEIPDTTSQHDDNSGYRADEIRRKRSKQTEIQECVSNADEQRLQGRLQCGERSGKQFTWSSGETYTGNWKFEPGIRRVANGIPGRVDRLKGLGNSIVPQIACLLFEQINPLL